MKKQSYYPSRINDQVAWLENFILKLPSYVTTLGLVQAKVDATLAACKWLHYILSQWINAIRGFSLAATGAAEDAAHGVGTSPMALPVFTAPTLPTGVVAVPPGVLTRLFEFVRDVKNNSAYTVTIGQDLGIEAREDAAINLAPSVQLKIQAGQAHQCVSLHFVKYGHAAVLIESRRNGGAWETLAVATHSPQLDDRPLLLVNAAETREYRLRFWDKGAANGDWTETLKIAVTT